MARKRILTWDKHGKRWKKIYRGRALYFPFGTSKSDEQGYRLAVEAWEQKKAELDAEIHKTKPYREHYEWAISARQEMAQCCLLDGDHKQHDRLVREIERLKTDFARVKPPDPTAPGYAIPFDPLCYLSAREKIEWFERVDALRAHKRWLGVTQHSETIAGNLETYLGSKRQQASSGQFAMSTYATLVYRLEHFRAFAGQLGMNGLNGQVVASFHASLIAGIEKGDLAEETASGILRTTKSFVRWAWQNEIIDNLPRNLDSLQIAITPQEIQVFTKEELHTLLTQASARTQLYLLLMLNCGMQQRDIADLRQSEVLWDEGRIHRKRSKTKRKKTVPKVNYKLWNTTLHLLRQFNSGQDRVLVNRNGTPLLWWKTEKDKRLRIDNIKSAYERLCRKLKITPRPLKLLRKTGASLLDAHKHHGRYAHFYLGKAPASDTERRYARPSEDQFDKAVAWLGERLGIK